MQLASRFASRSPVLRADHPLSDDQIRAVAPSIFAEDKHASRSERYSYIPTAAVLTELRKEGFQPFMVCQTRVRQDDRRDYTKHLIRLRHASQINGAEANEIILLNSHDGTSSYHMLIFACHHRRDSTCYPAYLQLNPRRGTMVTFSEELTVRNGEAGAPDHLILRDRSRRQGAPLLTRCARYGASRGHRAYAPDARAGQCLDPTHCGHSSRQARGGKAVVLLALFASIRVARVRHTGDEFSR